ncbi:related to negative acting factor [Cephalotrichum gorgonifer]|uniref:Related to negative acting factor n=1 Tax=Cephalotrichum gorgonifer TaxID=2041049 RepID=A0AAE8MXB2_9PEZI|nr:related to negative acting factor [Cephalotrichum gorgonifer]
MVYCGKPSKGCQNCRDRKIACDQRMPGCQMCEKHNRICPGYRNIVDLMFRDESEHVIWKANKPKPQAPRRSSASPTSGTKRKNKKKEQRRARSAARGSVSPGATSAAARSPVLSQSPPLPSGSASAGPGPRKYRDRLSPSDIKLELPEASFRTLSILTPIGAGAGAGGYFNIGSSPADDTSDDDDDPFLPSPDEDTWPSPPSSASDYTLSPRFQEQGMAFFFSRYVAATQENVGNNNYDFIYDIWRPNYGRRRDARIDAVLASATAVGLAAMSALTCSPERLDWARQSYITALRLTNDALMDPEEAPKDSTLLAVLILGTYERLAGPSPETMRAWRGHMRGAAALARLRGPAQFRTKAGVRMFTMLCETLAINCMHEDGPIPDSLTDLRDVLGATLTPIDATWNISASLYRILQIRYSIKTGGIENTGAIVDALLEVDQEYIGLVAGIPDSRQYSVVRLEKPNPIAFRQVCHVYPSLENASTWNHLRTLRQLVHETILSELYKSFAGRSFDEIPMEHKVQFARSRRLLCHLRDAVLASVPQHFGIVSSRDAKPASSDDPSSSFGSPSVSAASESSYRIISAPPSVFSPAPSPASSSPGSTPSSTHAALPGTAEFPSILDVLGPSTNTDALFMTLASASHPLVWPLYLLGMSSTCTTSVRRYIVERLTALHLETGLTQPKRVAEIVASREIGVARGDVRGVEGMPDVSREPTPVRI